ncbi:hypothetical protein F511_08446 [Dorcoceras hygrometricum]|uniref:non-specific serine/threonine protein kinase n=1 Tax=Dorcoceras hygrometricum TaxID=472368 RepID=A0A2Z7ABB4_9LAMI|nr:hypothetical protein F511_08446 [Dorcoceras hygrometricum]
MASSPDSAPASDIPGESPPAPAADTSPPSPPEQQVSPPSPPTSPPDPPASSPPPPDSSTPVEDPPSIQPPPAPAESQSPPAPQDPTTKPPPSSSPSPPASSNNNLTPPPSRGGNPTPNFTPTGWSQTPSALAPPTPRRPSNENSDSSSGTDASSSPSGTTESIATFAGAVAGGILILAILIICLLCAKRRRKKSPYIKDHGRPTKGGDQYHNGGNTNWNKPQNMDHIVNLPPPPGVMGTPGGWGTTPPPLHANLSNEFSPSIYNNSGQHPISLPSPSPNVGGNMGPRSQFSYEELAVATGGFAHPNLLGQGGFGFVHKGVLPDGREVAVKSLKAGSGQGEREFQTEVDIISRVHHRHLVSLVGYCIAGEQRMLVYEFVPNKTLEFHLHAKGQPVMDWATRLRIAVGSAKGLAYLHEDCHPRIIHRDIKTANILLDFNFEAMVADFGLAKLTSENYTHVSTRVMGTFGYLAPEYASSGKLTEKSDVFSFGVMLLELITGRKPVDHTNKTMEDSLVDWIVRALDGNSLLEDLNEGVKPGQSSAFNPRGNIESYDTGAYNADMMKFRKMVMTSQDFNSSEYGATSEYGLNPSSSSSSDSRELGDFTTPQPK